MPILRAPTSGPLRDASTSNSRNWQTPKTESSLSQSANPSAPFLKNGIQIVQSSASACDWLCCVCVNIGTSPSSTSLPPISPPPLKLSNRSNGQMLQDLCSCRPQSLAFHGQGSMLSEHYEREISFRRFYVLVRCTTMTIIQRFRNFVKKNLGDTRTSDLCKDTELAGGTLERCFISSPENLPRPQTPA